MALELKAASRIVKGQVYIQPTDLVLEKGTMNVLLGPTLSGKTSLMRLMAGLDEPGSPVAKLDNEKPQGETIAYDELIKSWQK